jgi:LPPG:FO 2-phospho-L-lactate transferase
MRQRITFLSGGTGSSKLLLGMKKLMSGFDVIANVADNFWFYGLYVCPDIDIACYTLSGIADRIKGWGIRDDTFHFVDQLGKLGFENWFRLGDMDLATSIVRTWMIREGKSLGEITKIISRALGIRESIIPASEEHYETHVITPEGDMHLQEFWVKYSGSPEVLDVVYRGIELCKLSKEAEESIKKAERIIICPANPVSSIMPILSLQGAREAFLSSDARKIAVSPIVGNKPFSGPACKFMKAKQMECSSFGIAKMYSSFIDVLVVHENDSKLRKKIEDLGVECLCMNTSISDERSASYLAERLLSV